MPSHPLATHAAKFRELHDGFLVLPNAWDPPSARLVVAAGASAVGTTSAGVAWTRGVKDAGGLDRALAVDAAARIAAAVPTPVTVDIEGGYDNEPGGVAATLDALIDAGVVGVNLEDSLDGQMLTLDDGVDLIGRAVDHLRSGPVAMFINARIDTYLMADGPAGKDALTETLDRARAYEGVGADGVFVPGLSDLADIASLVEALRVPVNIMVGPGWGRLDGLADVGVRRVSSGPMISMAAYAKAGEIARELLEGRIPQLPVADVNDLVGT